MTRGNKFAVAFTGFINRIGRDVDTDDVKTEKDLDRLRMAEWLLAGLLFILAALVMIQVGIKGPIQTLVWKLGLATIGSFLGYWVDRQSSRNRITPDSHPLLQLRRGIVVVGGMLTLALSL